MPAFKDHFSRQSAAYSRHRPGYPQELIEFVVASLPDRDLAIDCATGNGQAALQLAPHLELVLAVDASEPQIAKARQHARVRYAVATAERLPVASARASLVVAAQAVHWFDFDRYYAECRRVLKPRGAVAVWTYELFRFDNALDALVDDLYANEVGAFWPPERRYVEERYRTLPFPFVEERSPPFELVTHWTRDDVLGYLASWSAVQRYKDARGQDPLVEFGAALAAAWPAEQVARLRWPIHLRLGRV
jgi:ubiquinone/menaquinone biosynthesis C-methylase UbiE